MHSSLENKTSYKILKMNENQLKIIQYRFYIRFFLGEFKNYKLEFIEFAFSCIKSFEWVLFAFI